MNPSVLHVATGPLAHSRKAGFVFSVLSQHFPARIAILRVHVRCFVKIRELFQAGMFLSDT